MLSSSAFPIELLRLSAFAILTVTASASVLVAQSRSQHAHEHGAATLNIVWNGATVKAELSAAGADIVGFEHRANSKQDREAISAALNELGKAEAVIAWPETFSCAVTLEKAELLGPQHEVHSDDQGHQYDSEHSHDHDGDDEDSHSEFSAIYQWTCKNFNLSGTLRLPVFESFPSIDEIRVNFVGESMQGQQIATTRLPELKLEKFRQ